MKDFYSPKDLIELLGISKNTVYKYLRDGLIKSVRVGRGKYRVPVGEVEKLVTSLGGDARTLENVGGESEEEREGSTEFERSKPKTVIKREDIREDGGGDNKSRAEMIVDGAGNSDLFDWMMGIMSAMVGLSFFLFPSYLYRYDFYELVGQFEVLRFFLVIGGFLLIFSDVFWRKHAEVHRLVNLFMVFVYGWLTGLLAYGGLYQAAVFYFSLVVVFLLVVIRGELKAIKRYLVLVALLLLVSVGSLFVFPEWYGGIGRWVVDGGGVYAKVSVVILIAIVGALRVRWSRTMLLWLAVLVGIIFLWFAHVMVGMESWDRVVAYVVMGVFSFFFPYWKSYKVSWQQDRRQVAVEAMVITGVVIVVMGAFGYINSVVRKDFTERELKQRGSDISAYVEDWMDGAKKEIVVLSESRLLRQAIVSDDGELMYGIVRDFTRSSSSLLQTSVYDDEGFVQEYYPRTAPELRGTSMAFREYYQRALAGEVWVSDLFQASTEGSPWIAVVSASVRDEDGDIIGVVGARLDLFSLQDYLGGIRIGDGGRVVLVDSVGRAVVHPDKARLSEIVGDGYDEVIEINGGKGIVREDYDYLVDENGEAGEEVLLIGYLQPTNSNKWIVAIDKPASDVGGKVSGMMFVVMLAVMVVAILVVVAIRVRKMNRMGVLGYAI